MKILVAGASGVFARKLIARLLLDGHEVVGIDRRAWPQAPIEFHEVDVRKHPAREVFRRVRAEAVVHMATVTSLLLPGEERYRINLGGTRAIFEYCGAFGAAHCLFVGRHTYYGAGPDSALFHGEDDPPQELNKFPELADLVASDLYAAAALWRLPNLATTVLRLCYMLGPSGSGTLARFLRGKRVPRVLGFDPLFQFMHEDDVVKAIAVALASRPRGVFNVAGPQPLPLSCLVRETGRIPVPLPEFLFLPSLGRFGLPRLPAGALTHVKYPVTVDDRAFRAQTGYRHQHDEISAIRSYRSAYPAPLGSASR
ncbi:MAG: NAD-dependent epimerase/dehydratase family protein [Myxococcota bacterium]|nr:NAD-dependent epimerase/dehydratase family protein [Myxococcota bacterium]